MKFLPAFFLTLFIAAVICLTAWPQLDIAVSDLFYRQEQKFFLAENFLFVFLHNLAYVGARLLGAALVLLAVFAFIRKKPVVGVASKGWIFLFFALLIGPALVANAGLKDHWGRARPREIAEFGGSRNFSPFWSPQTNDHRNGSFVAGDAAFGFYLPAFAFVVPLHARRRKNTLTSRRIFWGGIGGGALFGLARIVMGAHFFSDVLFAAFFMLATSTLLHAAMYGRKQTAIYWRDWLFLEK